jgi:uncharacterized RDD family membrane protein YckC
VTIRPQLADSGRRREASGVERSPNERPNVVVGVVLSAGRFGVATGRFVLRPARAVTRTAMREPVVRAGVSSAARTAGSGTRNRIETATADVLAAPQTAKAVDLVLASPLPEALGRSLAEHHVVERMVSEVLASADVERAITAALESERTSKLAEQVLSSPALARMLNEALDSKLTAELAEKLVSSPEFDRMLEQAVSSPAVRAALARQTQSLGQDTAAGLRRRAVRVDDAAERVPRRVVRKEPRAAQPAQAGIGTRGIALAIDALIAQVIFLVIAATFGLIGSLVGGPDSDSVLGALAGAAWLIVVAAYFLTFWSGAGQTPGMRLMGLRLLDTSGSPPGFWRSALRLFGLGIAIAIAFLGFVPVLVDDRRRALQDFLAGTVVYYDELAPLPEDDAVAGVAARLAPTT